MANTLFRKFEARKDESTWVDGCNRQAVSISTGQTGDIEEVRLSTFLPVSGDWDCAISNKPIPWKTGRGLRLRQPSASLLTLYGEPDSKSPSTKGGQPLELWYYAFDWAGQDVPQVMEVVCTKEEPGKPGLVVEITLAASSL